ncbi:MAG: ABC transporter permease [Lutibacter sp.]
MFSRINLNLIIRTWYRNKTISIIALLSLILGIASCNLLVGFIINEWQISKESVDSSRIFLLRTDLQVDEQLEKSSYIFPELPSLLIDKYPEIESYCRFQSFDNLILESNNFKSNDQLILSADNSIVDFFKFSEINGSLAETLSKPNEIAITYSLEKKIFGKENALGKPLTISNENSKTVYKITSIIDDSKIKSLLKFDVLLPLDMKQYFGGITFLKLKNYNSAETLLKKLKTDISSLPRMTPTSNYYLQDFSSVYFDKSETLTDWEFLLRRDISLIRVSIFSAITILIIACFNYINMMLVLYFKNKKNRVIKKVLGAKNKQLQLQIISENFIAVIISFILSFGIIGLILPTFNTIFNGHLTMSIFLNINVLLVSVALIFILTIVPSIFIFSNLVNDSSVYSDKEKISKLKSKVVKSIVIVQFTTSIVLIIASFVSYNQLKYIFNKGNFSENIIEIKSSQKSFTELNTLKKEINKITGVVSGTISTSNFFNSWLISIKGNTSQVLYYNFDADFIKTHNLTLKSGNPFPESTNGFNENIIVNEAFVESFNLKNPIGTTIPFNNKNHTITGIIKDFHTEPFSKNIKPTVIGSLNNNLDYRYSVIQFKLEDALIEPTLNEIKKLWIEMYPNEIFSFVFIKDEFNSFHQDYFRLYKIVRFFTIISLLLTIFGLFGTAFYFIESRTKEIGIRKINGATITQILSLLNKNFIKWVGVAFVIAVPVSWYFMSKWLENFAYKITLNWWIFAISGIIALIIAVLTVSWQSFKAATKNPVNALRDE